MNPFEQPTDEELTDSELTQMLSTWTVPVPSDKLRTRFYAERPLFLAYANVAPNPGTEFSSTPAAAAALSPPLSFFKCAPWLSA